jgi:hypothetical protein
MPAQNRKPQRYVAEFVWLPTYLGVWISTIAAFGANFFVLFAAVVAARLLLETVYELVFGDRKNDIRNRIYAFAMQVLLWTLIALVYGHW